MNHNNSSTFSYPFAADSLTFDDDLLEQWLRALPSTDPQQNDAISGVSSGMENNSQLITPLCTDPIVDFNQCTDQVLHKVGSTFVEVSKGKGKIKQTKKEKVKAVEIERKRRQEMSGLYRSLRSILPAEYIKGKRATADHLQEAVRYIKDMEEDIAKLKEKRDALRTSAASTGNSSSFPSSNINPSMQYVTVKQCRQGFYEILLRSCASDEKDHQNLLLSKALRLLSREGLNMISCLSSRVQQSNFIHTIHAQVGEGSGIDLSQLQQQLIDCNE